MLSRLVIFFLFVVPIALHAQEQEDEKLAFILDSMTLVAENGERIVFREDYADVIKKDIKILREYDEQIIKFKFRILDYGSFKVLFDRKCKVRNIYTKEPGPEFLNGIRIGEPLEDFLQDFQGDSRYRVSFSDKHNHFTIGFTYFERNRYEMEEKLQSDFDPEIYIEYDEERRVSYINAGFVWP